MIEANETFGGTWPFEPHFTHAPGFRMHYVDEGEGEPILCLHGEPTWGYLYRDFIGPLSKHHRVVVPDHMGFGKSETPQDREYTLKTHVDNLKALVFELDLSDITLVVQDWGGPIGGCLTADHFDRVKRIFQMNTLFTPYARVTPDHAQRVASSRWFTWIQRAQKDGTLEAILGSLDVTVVSVMKHLIGFEKSENIDENWEAAYGGPFKTREECVGGIAFPLDFLTGKALGHRELATDEEVAALRQKPAMLACGMQDHAIPPDVTIEVFKNTFGEDKPIVELTNSGHFLQEDEPELLVALIEQFTQST